MSRDRIIDEIPTGRGFAIRISRTEWRGRARADIRHCFEVRPGDPDTRQPTKKGLDLLSEDYENEGLEPPQALRRAA